MGGWGWLKPIQRVGKSIESFMKNSLKVVNSGQKKYWSNFRGPFFLKFYEIEQWTEKSQIFLFWTDLALKPNSKARVTNNLSPSFGILKIGHLLLEISFF